MPDDSPGAPAPTTHTLDDLRPGDSAIVTWESGSTIGVIRRTIAGAVFLDFAEGTSVLVCHAHGTLVHGVRRIHTVPGNSVVTV